MAGYDFEGEAEEYRNRGFSGRVYRELGSPLRRSVDKHSTRVVSQSACPARADRPPEAVGDAYLNDLEAALAPAFDAELTPGSSLTWRGLVEAVRGALEAPVETKVSEPDPSWWERLRLRLTGKGACQESAGPRQWIVEGLLDFGRKQGLSGLDEHMAALGLALAHWSGPNLFDLLESPVVGEWITAVADDELRDLAYDLNMVGQDDGQRRFAAGLQGVGPAQPAARPGWAARHRMALDSGGARRSLFELPTPVMQDLGRSALLRVLNAALQDDSVPVEVRCNRSDVLEDLEAELTGVASGEGATMRRVCREWEQGMSREAAERCYRQRLGDRPRQTAVIVKEILSFGREFGFPDVETHARALDEALVLLGGRNRPARMTRHPLYVEWRHKMEADGRGVHPLAERWLSMDMPEAAGPDEIIRLWQPDFRRSVPPRAGVTVEQALQYRKTTAKPEASTANEAQPPQVVHDEERHAEVDFAPEGGRAEGRDWPAVLEHRCNDCGTLFISQDESAEWCGACTDAFTLDSRQEHKVIFYAWRCLDAAGLRPSQSNLSTLTGKGKATPNRWLARCDAGLLKAKQSETAERRTLILAVENWPGDPWENIRGEVAAILGNPVRARQMRG